MAEGALVRFENVDGIGVITVDNPPVNALSPGVPEGIVEGVERGNADPAIKAMVYFDTARDQSGRDIRIDSSPAALAQFQRLAAAALFDVRL